MSLAPHLMSCCIAMVPSVLGLMRDTILFVYVRAVWQSHDFLLLSCLGRSIHFALLPPRHHNNRCTNAGSRHQLNFYHLPPKQLCRETPVQRELGLGVRVDTTLGTGPGTIVLTPQRSPRTHITQHNCTPPTIPSNFSPPKSFALVFPPSLQLSPSPTPVISDHNQSTILFPLKFYF